MVGMVDGPGDGGRRISKRHVVGSRGSTGPLLGSLSAGLVHGSGKASSASSAKAKSDVLQHGKRGRRGRSGLGCEKGNYGRLLLGVSVRT